MTPTSHSATSPAISGSNHGSSRDLSPSSMSHNNLGLHTLRPPSISSGHGQSTGNQESNAEQTSPSLTYGANMAHLMSITSRVSQLQNSPLSKNEQGKSSTGKSATPTQSNATLAVNGLTPSPRDGRTTPTPNPGMQY